MMMEILPVGLFPILLELASVVTPSLLMQLVLPMATSLRLVKDPAVTPVMPLLTEAIGTALLLGLKTPEV